MKLTEPEARSLAAVYNMLCEIKTAGNDTILMAQCLSTMNKMFPIAIIEDSPKQDNKSKNQPATNES